MGLFDIFTEHMVTRIRLIVYGILVFFSFFIFVGIGVMKNRTNFLCPLYFDFKSGEAPVSNCNYSMAIAIIFQLIYALFRIVILVLLMLGKLTNEMFMFSNIMELVYVLIDVVAFILTFIGACILSAGHNESDLKKMDDWLEPSRVAQAGAWIGTILWLFLAALGAVYVLRAGKLSFTSKSSTSGNTAATTATSPPMETPPAYEQPKY